jgi:hypothetical protein
VKNHLSTALHRRKEIIVELKALESDLRHDKSLLRVKLRGNPRRREERSGKR